MGQKADSLAGLAGQITGAINEAIAAGRADRSDAVTALHLVLSRLTREMERDSREDAPMPPIRATDNRGSDQGRA